MTDTLKKHIFRLLAYALILAPFSVTGDDCMNIDEAVFAEHTRPFVCFVHDEHNENAGIDECDVCHHVYEDGKLVPGETSEDKACSECHGAKDDPKQFKLIATYHNRCRSCHLERKTGPITCGGCHEKPSRTADKERLTPFKDTKNRMRK